MKKKLLSAFALLLAIYSFSQNGFNYKALIKDDSGNAIANQAITVQFQILEDGTTNVYQETHNPTTDANGIIIVNIGEGTVVSGNFVAINWGDNNHFLNVQIDSGSGLVDLGTTQFKSVPYAQRAETAATVDNPVFFEPYILGVSSQTSSGRFVFNGKTGWQAANEMCKASYPNEPFARAFTNEQITQAIIIGNYSDNQNYNAVLFHGISSSTTSKTSVEFNGDVEVRNSSAGNNGQNLGTNANGLDNFYRSRILFNYTTPGSDGGITIERWFDVVFIENFLLAPCLCGTYKPAN